MDLIRPFVAFSLTFCAAVAGAQTPITLASFGSSNGSNPAASLVQAGDGNFYGVAPNGGANGSGTVYRVTTGGVLTTIYSFSAPNENGVNGDGASPVAALCVGSDGALYGTAEAGGTAGLGTVFKVGTDGSFTTLHSFLATEGNNPIAGLVLGSDGNYYGTTLNGGTGTAGTVFSIGSSGTLTTVHSFATSDGYAPSAALAAGPDGALYGTTRYGGANALGSVYRVTTGGGFSAIYSFDNKSGANPTAALVPDTAGNLYGVAPSGGSGGRGTFFKITTGGAFSLLHAFNTNEDSTTAYPTGLTLGGDGQFYGTTNGSRGALFKATSAGAVTTLYTFTGGNDGSLPQAAPTRGSDGNLYGTTSFGGANAAGTVFELTVGHPAFFTGEVSLGNSVYYLAFPGNGNVFGYYAYLSDPRYIYHFDLGYEYVFDAADGRSGVYFYDFASQDYFYTSPAFPFPYLYDFNLQSVLYYYPDPTNPQRYNTNGTRYFYEFKTGQIISK